MKLVDLTKCLGDSPDFRASLSQLEEASNLLEKRLKLVTSLCEERQALNAKERAVTQKLIREFDLIGSSDPCIPTHGDDWDTAVNSVEVMTTAMRQLLDNQERMFDQINIGIVKPLRQFLSQDLEEIKTSKKAYYKAHTEAQQITDKFGQCKKHEVHLLNEISLQLFDARAELHKATCTYALDLNLLHSKKTPDFLNRVVDFMMSQLSFFHLGHVTVKDVEPHITVIYGLVEKLRKQAMTEDTKCRTLAQNLMEEALRTQSQNLLHLHTTDLHSSLTSARDTIRGHLSKGYPDSLISEQELSIPTKTSTSARTKAGYMWYAEPRTFGIHWIRLYFYIKNSMLLSESTKVKVPISLNLNLCNVKPAEVNDTERNFSFKVTSPVRVLLLQAEGSLEMHDWIETLSNAITHAIHGDPSSPTGDKGLISSSSSSSSSSGSKTNGNSGSGRTAQESVDDPNAMPVKPPRRKSNVSKDVSAVPGNDVCADCGSNKPKWASVNLGVVICIECSGVHRSLGVYISQVRSLTLDSIKPSVVRRLKSIGNAKANAVYEALLPKDFDRTRLKKGENRQEFIMEKYVSLKYVHPSEKERIFTERQEARVESLRRSGVSVEDMPKPSNGPAVSGREGGVVEGVATTSAPIKDQIKHGETKAAEGGVAVPPKAADEGMTAPSEATPSNSESPPTSGNDPPPDPPDSAVVPPAPYTGTGEDVVPESTPSTDQGEDTVREPTPSTGNLVPQSSEPTPHSEEGVASCPNGTAVCTDS